MEDSAKKLVLIVVVVVCIAAAGVITYLTMGGGAAGGGSGKMWVKCNNPKCGADYQISIKEYDEFIRSVPGGPRAFTMSGGIPMKCQKCGEPSVFLAIKCEKCGKVFFPNTVQGQSEDKCPACGYSKNEQMSKSGG